MVLKEKNKATTNAVFINRNVNATRLKTNARSQMSRLSQDHNHNAHFFINATRAWR